VSPRKLPVAGGLPQWSIFVRARGDEVQGAKAAVIRAIRNGGVYQRVCLPERARGGGALWCHVTMCTRVTSAHESQVAVHFLGARRCKGFSPAATTRYQGRSQKRGE